MPRSPLLAALPLIALPAALLVGFMAAPASARAQDAPPAPPAAAPAMSVGLTADPPTVELGDIFDGEAAGAKVTFTNVSKADWAVARVATTCGCTVATVHGPDGAALPPRAADATLPMVTLKPGETISVDVEMLTTNQHGPVEKSLQVFPVDPALTMVTVPVRARVSKAFAVSPEMLNLANIPKSGRLERTIVLQAQAQGHWSIDGFESAIDGRPLPDYLKFEVLDTEGSNRRIQMVSDGPRPTGPITAKVRVKLGHERLKAVEFFVHGIVQSDVTFTTDHPKFPESISFDQMEPGAKVMRTLSINNSDASVPYLLDSVEIMSPKTQYFATEIRTIEEGVRYEVDITADSAIGETFFRGNLVLHARHPDLPSRIVAFNGWVRKG